VLEAPASTRITAPADELTLNGTLLFGEIGRPAQ
jgi:hypothetical protein